MGAAIAVGVHLPVPAHQQQVVVFNVKTATLALGQFAAGAEQMHGSLRSACIIPSRRLACQDVVVETNELILRARVAQVLASLTAGFYPAAPSLRLAHAQS